MQYQFSVKGKKVEFLNSAKSLLDYQLLRSQLQRSVNCTPVKKYRNFEFDLEQVQQTQSKHLLNTTRSRKTLISQQKSRLEKSSTTNLTNDQLRIQEQLTERVSATNNSARQFKLNNKVPNLQFNMNYHLGLLRKSQRPKKQEQICSNYSCNYTPRTFTNRVYKIRKNSPRSQFYLDCTKRAFDE